MEDIGDIKTFRKNLMIVSLSIIVLTIYSDRLSEINLGLIKFKEGQFFDFKTLVLLLLLLVYVLWRYIQYLKTSKIYSYRDDKLLILEVLKSNGIEKYISSFKKGNISWKYVNLVTLINNILVIIVNGPYAPNTTFQDGNVCESFNIPFDDNLSGMFINRIGTIQALLFESKEKSPGDIYEFTFKTLPKNLFLKRFYFIMKEKYYWDYHLPIYLGYIALFLLVIKISNLFI